MFTNTQQIVSGAGTRDQILGAARELLGEGGAAACSMRAVAGRAGLTAGAIYRHFADKDALINEVVASTFSHFDRYLIDAIVSLPVGSFARLTALGDAYIQFAHEYVEEFKILFNPLVTGRKTIRELPGQGGYAVLRLCVVEAMDAGTLRTADPDLLTFFLWSRVHGIVMLLLSCDFADEIAVEGAVDAPNLFRLTRRFIASGVGIDE